MVELLSSDDRNAWNALALREPAFALMQSWEWGQLKEKLGWKAYRFGVRNEGQLIAGAQLLLKSLPLGNFSVAYVPRGPIGKWVDPEIFKPLFQEIHHLASCHNAVLLKVEPPWMENMEDATILNQSGFRYTPCGNQPRATITVDLTPDLDTIFSQMRKSTRRKIKDGPRKGLTTRIGTESDLKSFFELLDNTAQRAGFSIHPYKYYQNEFLSLDAEGHSLLLFAYYENEPVAVNLSYSFGEHAGFFHQASASNTGNLNPNYLLVWEAIKLLKERGCRSYDLWGIPDEIGDIVSEGEELPDYSRRDGLWGVYKFKAGFSKNIVVFPGSYDYVYQRLPYSVISPVLSREDALEPLLKWASLNRIESGIPGISYALKEMRYIRSAQDVQALIQEASYGIRKRVGWLNSRHKIPLSLQLEPTNLCNADCTICPGRRCMRERGYMDWDLFTRIVDDAAKLGVRRIYLDLHGEPTLHPQIAQMIHYIKLKGLAVRMTTNGILFDKEMGTEILQTGMTRADHIIFSILGDATNTHNLLMENSNLESIRENIGSFLNTRKQLSLRGPVIETVFRRAEDNKYEEEGYQDTWAELVDHATLGGAISQSFANYKIASPPIIRETSCETIQERMTVYWDGGVTVCRHDLDGDYIVGNLNEQSIEEIWNNEQLSSLRKLHREQQFAEFELCAKCDF